MGSKRLPGKMLMCLNNLPIIDWVYKRAKKSKLANEVIVAIPISSSDDALDAHLKTIGAKIYRGSEDDVLARFYLCAKQNDASHIVRVCADNPFIDPQEIDNLINFYLNNDFDYVYNHIPRNNKYPDGFGAEMISVLVLEKMYLMANKPSQREHLLNYIWDNKNSFSISTFNPENELINHPELRFDIDTIEDYNYLNSFKEIDINCTAEEIVRLSLSKRN